MKYLLLIAVCMTAGCATMNADGTPTKTGLFWKGVGAYGQVLRNSAPEQKRKMSCRDNGLGTGTVECTE